MSFRSDTYYIEQVLEGNTSFFGELVDKHKNKVFNLAFSICGNREDAEEIAQDSFMKIYHSLKDFKNRAAFTTWLYRIVYNTSISFIRAGRNRLLSIEDLPDFAGTVSESMLNDDESDAEYRKSLLKFAMHKIGEEERGIITLYYYDEMSVEEISDITGISRSNVKIRLFRTRKRMLEIIQLAERQKITYYEGN
jgi:RNA polymerase sigma factor (sigma-70 family)